MSTQLSGAKGHGMDRRTVLAGAIWGTVGLTAATTAAGFAIAPAASGATKSVTYEAKCIHNAVRRDRRDARGRPNARRVTAW